MLVHAASTVNCIYWTNVCHLRTSIAFANLTQLVVDGRIVRTGSSEVDIHLGLCVPLLLVLRGAVLTAEQR